VAKTARTDIHRKREQTISTVSEDPKVSKVSKDHKVNKVSKDHKVKMAIHHKRK
jgi:hypothetical protein